jgi:hypothetical protein
LNGFCKAHISADFHRYFCTINVRPIRQSGISGIFFPFKIYNLQKLKGIRKFDSRRRPKKLNPMAHERCGHQPVITAAGYPSQADQSQIGGCLPLVSQANPECSPRLSMSAVPRESNSRTRLKCSEAARK